MPVPYVPLAIANSFIDRFAGADGIEHMKLQKLVYCSYGWWLAASGINETRLTTEGPEIWKHGPVFSSLYNVLKIFGRQPIITPQSASPFDAPASIDGDDDQIRALVDWIWARYGHLSGFALSDLTHKPGTPWHRVATENDFRIAPHTQIPDEYILAEFTALMHKAGWVSENAEGQYGGQPAA